MRTAAIAALALAVLATTACTSRKTTVQTSSGAATVTTSQDNKTVTVESSEGTVSVGQNVDQSKLGAPVYPGAQPNEQGSVTSTTDKGSSVVAAFKTADSFDKVYEYYKQQLPSGAEKMKMSSGSGSVASFQVGDDNGPDQVSVQVTSDKPGETSILITHVTKPGAAASPSP